MAKIREQGDKQGQSAKTKEACLRVAMLFFKAHPVSLLEPESLVCVLKKAKVQERRKGVVFLSLF